MDGFFSYDKTDILLFHIKYWVCGLGRFRSVYLAVNSHMLCRVSYETMISELRDPETKIAGPCFDQGTFWL